MPLGILENGEILRGEFTAGTGEDNRLSDLETTRRQQLEEPKREWHQSRPQRKRCQANHSNEINTPTYRMLFIGKCDADKLMDRRGTMSPGQQLQRLLAEIPGYEADDIVNLLPLAAALQSALYARILALQQRTALPETDYLLNTDEIAQRLGKSTKWVRDNMASLPFAFQVGREHRFSARGLEEWISEHRAARMASALPLERRQYAR